MSNFLNDFLIQHLKLLINDSDSVLLVLCSFLLISIISASIGIVLSLVFKCIPPFSMYNIIIHEYGHYKQLRDDCCTELGILCECFKFGYKKHSNSILYDGKNFNSAYKILEDNRTDPEYQKHIVANAKAGCQFYCKTIFRMSLKFSLLVFILFSWYYALSLFVCGLFLIVFEKADYHRTNGQFSDRRNAEHPEEFKYEPNEDCYTFHNL